MTGYVKWDDPGSPDVAKKIRPRDSTTTYFLPKGLYIEVKDKKDFKWFQWKADRNEDTWRAKSRLAEDDRTYQDQLDASPRVDKKDPNFDVDEYKREIAKDLFEKEEIIRQYFGTTLPKFLKEQKKIKED